MKPKHQRMIKIGFVLALLGGAVSLVLMALESKVTFFYKPQELVEKVIPPTQKIRLGGYVDKGSVEHLSDMWIRFKVTDFSKTVEVKYRGILPDLFREGQGVIAEGTLDSTGVFTASTILAKHDEKYQPPVYTSKALS